MPAALPPTAQAVADVIGRDATLTLARSVKFRSLYIPKRLPAGHWLRDVLGDQAAEALAEEFQGMQLPLARCANVFREERDRRILNLKREGTPVKDIARTIGMPESTVWKVVYRGSCSPNGHLGLEM